MRRPSRVSALFLVIGLFITGCASAGGGSGSGDSSSLTRQEITSVSGSTLYDVIQRLRPRWLREVRNRQDFGMEGGVVVYQGQTFLGGTEVLRQWGTDMAQRLVYLDGIQASNELSGPAANRHVEGAIVIHTR